MTVAVAAALAVACFFRFGLSGRAVVAAFFVFVLAVLAASDLERRLLPNRIVLSATAVVLVLQIALFPGRAYEWLAAAAGASLFFLLARLAYRAGVGMGDVKLGLLLGAGLGSSVVLGLFVGMASAAAWGLLLIARHGSSALKRTIPLGPFLAFGAIVVLLFGGSDLRWP